MKIWEEEWALADDRVLVVGNAFEPTYHGDANMVARAKLAAAAPEMARLLFDLAENYRECPACGTHEHDVCAELGVGHRPGCRIVAALEKAGVWDGMMDEPATKRPT